MKITRNKIKTITRGNDIHQYDIQLLSGDNVRLRRNITEGWEVGLDININGACIQRNVAATRADKDLWQNIGQIEYDIQSEAHDLAKTEAIKIMDTLR